MRKTSIIVASALLCFACSAGKSYQEEKTKFDEISVPPTDITTSGEAAYTTIQSNTISDKKDETAANKETEESSDTRSKVALPDAVNVQAKQLIQTADIKFQVEDIVKSTDRIEELIKKYGAYVSTSNMETSYNNTENRMSVRIAPDKFNTFIKDLMSQSIYTNYKNIRSEDVTAEYVDIETRLKTKREVEQRYIEILRNKAKTVAEVLQAEDEIRVIHEEIESKTGRLNYLKDQVANSTINLEFYQATKVSGQPERIEYSYWSEAGDAFKVGWTGLKRIFIGLIYIWPLYLFGLLSYWIIRRFVIKKKK